MRARLLPACIAAGILLAATACGGDEARDPQAVLDAAAERLSAVETAHVEITSEDLPDAGSVLIGGEGDVQRPDSFAGTLSVRAAGATADVEVLSTGGQLYAQLPFASSLTAVDPEQFGFGDPGALVQPDGGLDRLLREATSLEAQDAQRVDGEVVDTVTGELPGQLVADLLTSADPSAPVQARFVVTREGDELRELALTGPFYDAPAPTTYRVALTAYDEPVDIPAAPEGDASGGS